MLPEDRDTVAPGTEAGLGFEDQSKASAMCLDPSAKAAFESVSRVEPGTMIGRYRIVSLLAAGGMGAVYKAEDTELDCLVALKVLHPALAGNPEAVAMFKREVRAASQVTHPNVCRVYEFGLLAPEAGSEQHGDPILFLTMELLSGETLADLIRRRGRLQPEEAWRILAQAGEGLAAAHSAGLIHRDFKPGNIMLS